MFTSSIGFQSPVSPIMEGIVDLHNYIFFYLVLVSVFVFWIFYTIIKDFVISYVRPLVRDEINQRFLYFVVKHITHLPVLEMIWTVIPSIILMFIAVPSFTLLYAMDEVIDPSVTMKAVGHQWYWSYEYSDDVTSERLFDSYMKPENELSNGMLRLLEVDEPVVLPTGLHIRVIVTSEDVLHSWAVPSMGLKVDAVPGRLSQLCLFVRRPGVYYGQCSELCGVNHGFMPIVIRAVDIKDYWVWLTQE